MAPKSKHRVTVQLHNLAQKLDRFGLVDCCVGSGHRRSSRAVGNINPVNDLLQSQDELPQSFSMH